MRRLLYGAALALLTACGNNTGGETAKTNNDTAKIEYAYTVEHPDNWQWGSRENTKIALQSLKHFETGNFEQSAKGFADTVILRFDNFEDTLSNAELVTMFQNERKNMNSVRVKMEDFESVKSKTGDVEYVSLWYKQYVEDKKGKVDSMSVMDDLRMKNGKIVEIDEKMRRFPKK